MKARLQYNRVKFEQNLQTKSNFYGNLSDKLPVELKVSHLPISYHYYDAVPILMAVSLSKLKFTRE